jgi:chromosome segregation ATPase
MTANANSVSTILFSFLIASALLSASSSLDAREIYRYKDASGVSVINDRLPPEVAALGYEVLSDTGVLLRVVPPKKTPEQLEALDAQESEAERAQRQAEQQRKADELLLIRYSSIDDIKAARERSLQALQIRANILRSNLRSMAQQLGNYQAEAAAIERLGHLLDQERIDAIQNLRARIETSQLALSDREQEMEEVTQAYQADIDRFQHLMDQVLMRRSLSSPQ